MPKRPNHLCQNGNVRPLLDGHSVTFSGHRAWPHPFLAVPLVHESALSMRHERDWPKAEASIRWSGVVRRNEWRHYGPFLKDRDDCNAESADRQLTFITFGRLFFFWACVPARRSLKRPFGSKRDTSRSNKANQARPRRHKAENSKD